MAQAPNDEFFMAQALNEARAAAERGEVPVGALIVREGEIVARVGNQKEASAQPTHHAEVLAIQEAAKKLGRWRLNDCELYVTLEPCLMCCGTIVQARLKRVIFGALDPKAGAVQSLYQTLSDPRLNHRPELMAGVRAAECGSILSEFFRARRS